jgi:phage portal protein BeeE
MTWWTDIGDSIRRRFFGWDGWGGQGEASGAAVITTSYGINGNEAILPSIVANAMQAYCGNAVVFGAILARMSLFAEATFAFQDMKDKSLHGAYETDGRRNTGLSILEYPWPNGTTGELLARMIQDVDLAGNAYVWNAGSQLVRLRPDWVMIISEITTDAFGREFRKVLGYLFDPPPTASGAPGTSYFTIDEVAHWSPIPDPWADFRGMSWMTPIIREVAADNGMTEYKIKYLTNAASPNLLIKYAQKLGDKAVRRVQDMITDRHGGVDNAFRTLVLDEGADTQIIGNSLEQMNFSTVQAAGENRIIIASGVPGIVIGSKEGLMAATYSNYAQAMRRFADITMRPLWRSACACLAVLVTVPAGERLWFDPSDISALRQGEKEQADTTLVLAQACAALVKEGYEPKSVAIAVTSGDLTKLKYVDKPPDPLLEKNLVIANPSLAPAANAPGAVPTQSDLKALNPAPTPALAGATK